MGFIDIDLNEQLNLLIGKAFNINRMLDRGMSLLMVQWKLVNSSTILHEKLAHAYPGDQFADAISDYQGRRGMLSIYPATDIGNRVYDTVVDFFKDYLAENIEFENMIKDGIEMAKNKYDYTTEKFLKNMLSRLTVYTDFAQELIDLYSNCDNDKFKLMILDSEIDDYIKF